MASNEIKLGSRFTAKIRSIETTSSDFTRGLSEEKEESLVSICGVGPCFAIDRSGAILVF
jgi:hypothetical protein